jgi:hypothetical protein
MRKVRLISSEGSIIMFTNMFAYLLFIDNIEDSCMMSLPIFLIHEEGMTDKFRGVNDRHRR